MTHERARALILAGRVDPLGGETLRPLGEHLSSCTVCGEYAEQVERGLAAFRSHAVVADAELAERTRALLRARAATQRPPAPWPWGPVAAGSVGGTATATCFLLTQRLALWCHGSLGVTTSVALAWVAFVWLPSWAFGAVATIAVCHRGGVDGRGWPSRARGLDPLRRAVMETHEITLPSPADLPRAVKVLAALVYVAVVVATLTASRAFEPNAPPVPVQFLLGALWGIPAALIVLAPGFVHADAGSRGINATLWTLLVALLVPGAIGFVVYFLCRKPLQTACPGCRATVRETANYCPQCGSVLKTVCPTCRAPRRPLLSVLRRGCSTKPPGEAGNGAAGTRAVPWPRAPRPTGLPGDPFIAGKLPLDT